MHSSGSSAEAAACLECGVATGCDGVAETTQCVDASPELVECELEMITRCHGFILLGAVLHKLTPTLFGMP